MLLHPEFTKAVVDGHVADLRQAAERHRQVTAARPGGTVQAVRRRSGWWLIEIGLRLATPKPALLPVRR